MGLGDIASNVAGKVGNNLKENLGAIEKAVLEIYDLRENPNAENGAVQFNAVDVPGCKKNSVKMGANGASSGVMTYADQRSIQDILALATSKRDLDNSGRMSQAQNALNDFSKNNNPASGKALSISNISRKLYSVQFNPTTIQISAHGGGLVRKLNYENAIGKNGSGTDAQAGGIVYGREATTIILTVPLLFDKCDIQDAFMFDKLNTSITEMGKGLVKGAMTLAGKKEVSVQKEVEGFIGMIRNRKTRFVTFHWGDMNYSGSVNDLDVRYTMFNVTGQPVRATVNMTIMCLSENMKHSEGIWRDMYVNSFTEEEKNMAQKFGEGAKKWTKNFLNL